MSYEFRQPSVSASTAESQTRQLLSFLRQHIQELNFVVRNLERAGTGGLTEAQRKEVQAMVDKAMGKQV